MADFELPESDDVPGVFYQKLNPKSPKKQSSSLEFVSIKILQDFH